MTARHLARASWCLAAGAVVQASQLSAQSQSTPVSGPPTQTSLPFCCERPRFLTAASEVVGLLAIPWYFNRFVSADTTAALSPTSWRRNIERGFEWDNNGFPTNMFMHPYHGNLFFNAARNNGYGYWESFPFAFAGSFLWEFFGENNSAAINDWVATSVGGTTIGEALYRTSRLVWDNTATGAGRAGREIAGFLLNPVGGFNRAVRGEMTRVGPNPPDRFPTESGAFLELGARSVEEGDAGTMSQHWFFDVTLHYGDPFEGGFRSPFDAFQLSAQLNGSDKTPVGRLAIEGALWGAPLQRSERTRHVVSVLQGFEYTNNEAYETGGQQFTAALLSNFKLSDGAFINTRLQGSVLFLWGVGSEYAEILGRDYDFGPGVGMQVRTALNLFRTELVEVGYDLKVQHIINGVPGTNFLHLMVAKASIPMWRSFGVGADFRFNSLQSSYRDFPDVIRNIPEFRIYLKAFPRRAPDWARLF